MKRGKSALHSVLDSVAAFEDDIDTGVYIVGRGGFPNSSGMFCVKIKKCGSRFQCP